ncbi:MAG: hypothetical protein HC880_05675 [Bacteroidia bacterium]|nr:hypothetical protein [Bacteroidia bacterium]
MSNWQSPEDSIRWQIQVMENGKYTIQLNIKKPEATRTGEATFRVQIGNQYLDQKINLAGVSHEDWILINLGTLALPKGEYPVLVRPINISGFFPMNLAWVMINKL